jgi:hypothetical protein
LKGINVKTIETELTFTEELLGTCAGNPELYEEFIQSKQPEDVGEDEAANLPPVQEQIAKGTTVFMRDEKGNPFIYDYLIKGFFKEACAALRKADDTESEGLKAFKKEIDGLIFIKPRQLILNIPQGGKIGICQRPLRAQTAQGERISLARSETVPVGTTVKFSICILKSSLEDVVIEWLQYGQWKGLGQWRNASKGRFDAKIKA